MTGRRMPDRACMACSVVSHIVGNDLCSTCYPSFLYHKHKGKTKEEFIAFRTKQNRQILPPLIYNPTMSKTKRRRPDRACMACFVVSHIQGNDFCPKCYRLFVDHKHKGKTKEEFIAFIRPYIQYTQRRKVKPQAIIPKKEPQSPEELDVDTNYVDF